MRRFLLFFVLMITGIGMIFAQSGQKLSYQAVIRNSANQLVTNTQLEVTIGIANSENGAAVYTEHHTVTTNANGLISLMIGTGDNRTGDWGQIEWDHAYVTTNTVVDGVPVSHKVELTAVAHAFYADNVDEESITEVLSDHGIVDGAEPNVQGDWNQENTGADDYIKNKPNISNVAISGDYNDLTNKPDLNQYVTNVHLNDTLSHYLQAGDLCDSIVKCDVIQNMRDSIHTNATNIATNAENIANIQTDITNLNKADSLLNVRITRDSIALSGKARSDSAYLKGLIDENLANITTNTTNITNNTTNISNITNNITNLQAADSVLGARFAQDSIALQKRLDTLLTHLCDSIEQCEVIQNMRDSIRTNAANIATNAANIATNTENIANIRTDITHLQEADAALSARITADSIRSYKADSVLSLRITADSANLAQNYYNKTKINDTVHYILSQITTASGNLSDNYYTKAEIDDTLGHYTTSDKIDSLLSSYAKSDTLKNYLTISGLCDSIQKCEVITDLQNADSLLGVRITADSVVFYKADSVLLAHILNDSALSYKADSALLALILRDSANLKDNYYNQDNITQILSEYVKDEDLDKYLTISSLCDSIQKCEVIKNMRDSIRTNAANIQTNATNIQTNAENIANVRTDITNLKNADAALSSRITADSLYSHRADSVLSSRITADSLRSYKADSVLSSRITADSTNLVQNYYNKGNIDLTLSNYATTESVNTLLGAYEKKSDLCADVMACDSVRNMRDSIRINTTNITNNTTNITNITNNIMDITEDLQKVDSALMKRMDTLLTHVCDSVQPCVTGWIKDSLSRFLDSAQVRKTIHDSIGNGTLTITIGDGAEMTTTTFKANDRGNKTVNFAKVAGTGSYDDLKDKPEIPDAQVQSDWNQSTTTAKDYIKNKPDIRDSVNRVVLDSLSAANSAMNKAVDTIARNASMGVVSDSTRMVFDTLHKYYATKDTLKNFVNKTDLCNNVMACEGIQAMQASITDVKNNLDSTKVNIRNEMGTLKTNLQQNIDSTSTNVRGALKDSLSRYLDSAQVRKTIHDTADVLRGLISAAPGTLNTNNTVALEVNPSEALSGNVSLHKVSKTGNYEDLNGKPTNVSQFSNDAGYTTAAGNNNFTGTNDFTEGTITVPSKFDIKNPPTDTTCTQDAVNICDLLAVFDSLNNRIQKLENELAAMSQPTTNKVSIELSDVTRTSIKATASMSNNDLTITSYEFCISESSSMSNPIDCRSVTNNEYTFTGLTPNTVYYATVKAFHSSGNVPSEVASAKTLPLTIDISINPGSPVCLCDGAPTEVTFTANIEDADMEEYSFSWSVAEGDPQPANSEETTCTITYSVSASYTVSCTATLKENSAVKLTADTTITVQNCTTPTITTCETDSTVTVMSVTGNPSFIDWNDGTTGTSVSANSTSPTTHKYGELGVYTITVSKDGCSYGHKVALGDAALYPCSVSAAHTSTTDYTGSSTTPGTGGLETVNSDGKITHVADQDGNVYPVVQIGSQCWMAKNLRTEHFSNGVGMTLTQMVQIENSSPTYNDTNNIPYRYEPVLGMDYLPSWGYYYNWRATMYENTPQGQGICPKGWHVPSKEEWETMATVVNGSEVVFPYSDISVQSGTLAGKLSSGCTWKPIYTEINSYPEGVGQEGAPGDYNNPERNASGFSSIPAGWVSASVPGWATDFTNAYYWTSTLKPYNSTSAYAVCWNHNYTFISCIPMATTNVNKTSGLSVRCVRDGAALTSYPTLSVTPSATSLLLCPETPETVTYTAAVTKEGSTTHEGYTYTWKVTNLKTNTTETLSDHSYEVTIPYSDSANYKVSCVAKSNTTTDSAKNSVMTLVKIKVAPSFTPSVSGFTVTLNNLSYVNTVKWTSDGEVVNLPNPATHTYDGVGTYQITAYSAANCPLTQEVEIEASVVLTASNNTTICPNGSTTVTYTATVDGATATGYSWELTSGNTGGFSPAQGTSSPFEVTYTTAGTYTYSCTATLEGGGSLSKEITTTITESEAPVFTTCVDGKWLTVSGMSNVATVHWTLSGSGETVAANAPLKSHKYGDNESTYSIKAVSSNGCETTASGDLGTAPSTNCRVTTVGQDNEEYDGDKLLRVKDKATNETNWYSVVQIGSQCWMAENLRAWASVAPDPFNNNSEYRSKFGRLYNWETAQTYCPTGWHLPSLAEWEQMESVVAGSTISHSSINNYVGTHAGLLAEVCDWKNSDATSSPGNNAQNTYGFRVLPSGNRNMVSTDYSIGQYASFWCSDDGGVAWTMKYDQAGTMKESVSTSGYYISVRCVRDEAAVVPTPTLTVTPDDANVSFCPDASQTVTYTASLTLDNEPITSGYSYVWSVTSTDAEGFTNIEQQSTGTTPSLEINYTIPGHYTVSCTATSSTTSCSTYVNTTVALKDASSFTVSKTGLQVTLDGLPDANTTITWTATGTPEDLASNPHTYPEEGTYKITVTNTETGCSTSADVTVPLVLSITPNGTAGICTGGSTEITYTAKVYDNGNEQPADNYTYQWSVDPTTGAALSGTGATVTVTYSATGTYAVACTASAATGSASHSEETEINALDPTFTSNSVEVDGATVTLTELTNTTQVNWGDGNTNGDSSHIYTGTPGEHYYTIVAINTNATPNCSTTVATVQVTIPSSGGFICGTSKVTDVDGNEYNTVEIGTQCWMKENLKVKNNVSGLSAGGTTSTNDLSRINKYYYYPNFDQNMESDYGLLYNWAAAMNGTTSQGICPSGWHIPSYDEWLTLFKYIGDDDFAFSGYYSYTLQNSNKTIAGQFTADSINSVAVWKTANGDNAPGNHNRQNRNTTGFSALPAGAYALGYLRQNGTSNGNPLIKFNENAMFWSSTEWSDNTDCAYRFGFQYDSNTVRQEARAWSDKKAFGSVRCVRN